MQLVHISIQSKQGFLVKCLENIIFKIMLWYFHHFHYFYFSAKLCIARLFPGHQHLNVMSRCGTCINQVHLLLTEHRSYMYIIIYYSGKLNTIQ